MRSMPFPRFQSLHALRAQGLLALALKGYAYGYLFRVTEDESAAVIGASFGDRANRFLGFRQPLDNQLSLTATAVRTRQPMFVNRLASSASSSHPLTQALGAQSLLVLPLVHRTGRVIGALVFADVENPLPPKAVYARYPDQQGAGDA